MTTSPFDYVQDGLLQSASVLAALIVVVTFVESHLSTRRRWPRHMAAGLAFGLFSASCMVWPVSGVSGFLLDMRVVPVVLAAPFFGLPAGILTFLIAAGTRLYLGGVGVVAGTGIIAIAFCGSLIFAIGRGWRIDLESEPAAPASLTLVLQLALLATVSMAVPIFALNAAQPNPSLELVDAAMAVVLVVPFFTFVAGLVLQAEERRQALDRALRANTERLEGIISNVPGVIFRRTWEPGGRPVFQMVAGRVREVIGIDAEELMRSTNALTDRIVPEDAARVRSAVEAAYRGDGRFEAEFRIRHADGTIRWLHGKSQFRDPARHDGIGDGILVDVTRLRVAEDVAAKAKERADWLADHDALTGLLERLALMRRATQELQVSPEGVALVLVDLRGSKRVNERFGHAIGDSRIIEAARRMKSMLPTGLVARMAGDTFGLLVTDGRSAEAVAHLAASALAALDPAMRADGAVVPLGAHCGYAVIEERGQSIETLVRSAEIALEVARERRDALAVCYSQAIEAARGERQRFIEALGVAIERGELTLVWQLIAELPSRRPVGREALLRWNREGHGPVSPEVFVEAADRSGLWAALDRYVLAAACHQAAAREDFGWISVNVTAHWVNEGDLLALVRAVLAESGLAPGRLTLEFTERIVIDQHDKARDLINELRALGVQVAIDDFGAVYSSLAYLHHLPIGKIKLDRAFIQDLDDNVRAREVVEAVLDLSARLDISVVAEGVETETQLGWLAEHGCQFVQGYLLGKPGPAA